MNGLNKFNFLNIFKKKKLIILDDVFPYLLTGFRIAEYNYYFKKIKKSTVFSSASNFKKYKQEYDNVYPEFKKKVYEYNTSIKFSNSLIYTIFINNMYSFLPIVERDRIPFVFTLYPGGGLGIDDEESDMKLRRVCESKFLKKVIVTQKNTYEYLLNKNFLDKDKIEFIYGGVLPSDYFESNECEKEYFPGKKTFDICFVANKYTKGGVDKGLDVFMSVANELSKKFNNINFHIVGGFTSKDADCKEILDRVIFYGIKYKEFFPQFYSKMDIILSPNIPYKIHKGNFDGFPTGSCIEAGLNGVGVMCTDELNMNIAFKDGFDICLIKHETTDIVNKVSYYYKNPEKLYKMSQECKQSFFREFNLEHQMKKRMEIISANL